MRSPLLGITLLACMAGCENYGRDLSEDNRDRSPPPADRSLDRPAESPALPPMTDRSDQRDQTMTQTPPAERDAGSNLTLQPADRTFVEQALSGGMFEVQSAEAALRQAMDDDLKETAQMILDEHRAANAELKAIAASKGVAAPAELQGKHQDLLDQLGEPNAVDYAAKFRQVQITAHQDAIALFEEYAANGRDAELKAFAEKTLPSLRKHLEHLQGGTP